jgi:hypothetical protein
MEQKQILSGYAIVVADRGFVYIGDVEYTPEMCVVRNARNIRIWGTNRGLGQLALSGPTKDTVLDDVGVVRIPIHAVISLIDTERGVWT